MVKWKLGGSANVTNEQFSILGDPWLELQLHHLLSETFYMNNLMIKYTKQWNLRLSIPYPVLVGNSLCTKLEKQGK